MAPHTNNDMTPLFSCSIPQHLWLCW